MRLYATVTVDEYDHFEVDVTDSGDPPEHGVVRAGQDGHQRVERLPDRKGKGDPK
jgi:hypothetical protein